jgi:hypothetical protein
LAHSPDQPISENVELDGPTTQEGKPTMRQIIAFVLIMMSSFASALAANPNPKNNPILKEIFHRLDTVSQIELDQYLTS